MKYIDDSMSGWNLPLSTGSCSEIIAARQLHVDKLVFSAVSDSTFISNVVSFSLLLFAMPKDFEGE